MSSLIITAGLFAGVFDSYSCKLGCCFDEDIGNYLIDLWLNSCLQQIINESPTQDKSFHHRHGRNKTNLMNNHDYRHTMQTGMSS